MGLRLWTPHVTNCAQVVKALSVPVSGLTHRPRECRAGMGTQRLGHRGQTSHQNHTTQTVRLTRRTDLGVFGRQTPPTTQALVQFLILL